MCEKHSFVDVYDEKEEIPDEIINIVAQYRSEGASKILEAGKLKTKVYVMSYCKDCGEKVVKEV